MYSAAFKDSELYKKFSNKALSSFTAADIYTALQAIQKCGERELEAFDYLNRLLMALAMDSSGRRTVVEQNSSTQETDLANLVLLQPGKHFETISGTDARTYATMVYYQKIALGSGAGGLVFTSNAGGNLDADVTMLTALAGFYGVVVLGKIRASDDIPAGATLVIQNGAGVAIATLTLPALTANVPDDTLDGMIIKSLGSTDNSAIYLDTTSSGLGDTKTWWLDGYTMYET